MSLSPLMTCLLVLCLGLLCVAALPSPAVGAEPRPDFVVAPSGNDSWSGRLAAPSRRREDGPFATLERARDAVRQLKAREPDRRRPIVVLLRGGTYFLRQPLTLTPEDSGTAQAPVVYAAYGREKPVLNGGSPISGWTQDTAGRWQVTLPEVKSGAWNFAQLFVGGKRRNRPRLPKKGYYFIADALPPSPRAEGHGFDRFRFRPGDIRAEWHSLRDVEVLAFQTWTMARLRIESVDTAENVVQFTGHTRGTAGYASLPKGNRFLVENVREALSEPGEWYLDRASGALTYLSRPGERPDKTVVIAPRLERLLELKGDVAKRRWVEHIHFHGLAFTHTNWNAPPEGNAFPQAEVNLGGAIHAEGARDCVWDGCRVTQVGTYAVDLGPGCKRNRLIDCELSDLGAGGIKIGEMRLRENDEEVASHTTVENCLIAHGGRLHPAAVGVWIGHSPHNRIERNTIHDLYYTGISPGWSWGYGKSGAHHNTIAYNHIFNIGQGVLSDMGGIYTLGVSPGSILHHNHIHDVASFDYGGWGIYFDEGTTGMVAENNVVYRTKSAGFHQHYGRENIVRNNIFAFGQEAQLMRTRPEEHLSFTLERNIIVARGDAPILGSNWSGDNYKLDYNLYWNPDTQSLRFAGMTLEEWQKKGQDRHSLIADPKFVDPVRGDFRLQPGSPAAKIGFRPIDLSRTGRQPAPKLTQAPRAFPPPPPPQPIAEGFENTPVGEKAASAATQEESSEATVRVTDETAASGRHSLKFVDAAGQKNRFNPHIFFSPKFSSGALEGRFALRIEPGAVFYHEWRDNANPYHVGPSLRVGKDGTLSAGRRTLTTLKHGQWLRFEIVCGLGDQATGAYDLTIRFPGRTSPQRFTNLPCSSDFRALRWFGFVADAAGPGVFYLDEIALTPHPNR